MKNEKVLDNNDIQIPIDLNIASEQSLNKKKKMILILLSKNIIMNFYFLFA